MPDLNLMQETLTTIGVENVNTDSINSSLETVITGIKNDEIELALELKDASCKAGYEINSDSGKCEKIKEEKRKQIEIKEEEPEWYIGEIPIHLCLIKPSGSRQKIEWTFVKADKKKFQIEIKEAEKAKI